MAGASPSDVGLHHDERTRLLRFDSGGLRVSNCHRSMGHDRRMCRNIRVLHNFEPPATDAEVHEAALQYVRKISGGARPSKANEDAFARAVAEITASTRTLLDELVTTAPPKDREVEAHKARERARERYAG
jgi:hypothetical protein